MSRDWYETDFFYDILKGIYGPRKGGAKIIIDAQNAATGVGKTSLAVALAERLADVFGYELQPEDLTLSGKHYLKRWKEHPDREQPSVPTLDELAGAGAGERTAVDVEPERRARLGMADDAEEAHRHDRDVAALVEGRQMDATAGRLQALVHGTTHRLLPCVSCRCHVFGR